MPLPHDQRTTDDIASGHEYQPLARLQPVQRALQRISLIGCIRGGMNVRIRYVGMNRNRCGCAGYGLDEPRPHQPGSHHHAGYGGAYARQALRSVHIESAGRITRCEHDYPDAT